MRRQGIIAGLGVVLALAVASGCGSTEATKLQTVTASLTDAGYLVDPVDRASVFGDPEATLAVEGKEIPSGAIVAVEFYGTQKEATRVVKQYEALEGSAVEARDSVVYSSLPPIDRAQLEGVLDAVAD